MSDKSTQISCPKCGHEFAVEDVISKQLEEKYRDDLNLKITEIESDYKTKAGKLAQLELDLKQQQKDIDETIAQRLITLSEQQERDIQQKIALQYD